MQEYLGNLLNRRRETARFLEIGLLRRGTKKGLTEYFGVAEVLPLI